MKIHDCIQGTSQWMALRAGIPTASEFDSILTPGGKASSSAPRYMYTLLAERMMGKPGVNFMSEWMNRGKTLEGEAVQFYELQHDCETTIIGFITNDAGTVGASPDRLVGAKGLLEVKCPADHTHVAYLLAKEVDKTYYSQIQGQLWIAEREWSDIISYHPEMPPALIRVERDEPYIAKLEKAVVAFCEELERLYLYIMERGWMKSEREQVEQMFSASIKLPPLPPLEELLKTAGPYGK